MTTPEQIILERHAARVENGFAIVTTGDFPTTLEEFE